MLFKQKVPEAKGNSEQHGFKCEQCILPVCCVTESGAMRGQRSLYSCISSVVVFCHHSSWLYSEVTSLFCQMYSRGNTSHASLLKKNEFIFIIASFIYKTWYMNSYSYKCMLILVFLVVVSEQVHKAFWSSSWDLGPTFSSVEGGPRLESHSYRKLCS